ncbi:MAG: glycosyltransferase family 4 protein, partial [Gemmatimonadaceae bacterium]
ILPVDTGGKIRSYNLARQLARRHELTFLSYYDGAADANYEKELEREFPGAVAICTGAPMSGVLAQGAHYAQRLPLAAPYAVSKFTDRRVTQLVSQWTREERFDVQVCDFLAASLNFAGPLTSPVVLFQHNVESALWARQAHYESNPLKRAVFALEASKMARYERQAVQRFHHIIAVSDHDKALMSEMTDSARITVVPTGVDLSHYREENAPVRTFDVEPLVLFLGSMDWEANVDGVSWFCDSIWPRVRAAIPAARFRIVGRNPNAKIKALASDDIEVTGTVPSVVEHLREAAVFVVPLRIGGGTRLKIFEAMATGRAVVSTRVGAEGLDVMHNEDVILEDDPAPFADAVIAFLEDGAKRRRFEASAAATAARFDWSQVVSQFEGALEAGIASARQPPVAAAR